MLTSSETITAWILSPKGVPLISTCSFELLSVNTSLFVNSLVDSPTVEPVINDKIFRLNNCTSNSKSSVEAFGNVTQFSPCYKKVTPVACVKKSAYRWTAAQGEIALRGFWYRKKQMVYLFNNRFF